LILLILHSILILQIVADTYADLVTDVVVVVDFQAQIHRSAERGPIESNNYLVFVSFVFVVVVFVFVFSFVFRRSAERGPFESNQAPS